MVFVLAGLVAYLVFFSQLRIVINYRNLDPAKFARISQGWGEYAHPLMFFGILDIFNVFLNSCTDAVEDF